jgi:hypothetical protein
MSVEGLKPNPVETFGGFVSLPDPSDVPGGMSPECGDVIFATGRVQSRPGMGAPFPDEAPAKINGLKTYVKIDLDRRLIVLLSTGVLKVERSAGSLDTITTNLKDDLLYKSVTLFGREYMAFSQDGIGEEFPFYFDDVDFSRVSPSGPGVPGTATNESANDQDYNTGQDEDHELNTGGAGAQGNLGQAIQFQSNVKVQTIKLFLKSIGTPAGFVRIRLKEGNPNDLVNPDNVGVTDDIAVGTIGAGYTFITFTFPEPLDLVALPDNGQYHIVFEGDAAYDAAYVAATDAIVWGADGTAPTYAFGSAIFFDGVDAWSADTSKDFLFEVSAISGVITLGLHKMMMWFETKTGYWTKASPSFSWTAEGNKSVQITNIPIGPDYVVARRFGFTIAGGEEFYHIADTMRLGDNTNTNLLVDFTDVDLLAGALVDKQLRALQLPPEACVTSYANRLVWVGERNRLQQFVNLSFDGGFQVQTTQDVPLGWTLFLTGGRQETVDTIHGHAYKLTGDGSITVGYIFQNAAFDKYNNLPLLEAGRAYRIKCRAKRSAGLVAGFLNIDIIASSVGLDTIGLQLSAGAVTEEYQEFEAELMPSQTVIADDLQLRVFADNTPTSGEFFLVDELEIWPSDRELNPSTARVSDPDRPEFYDNLTGLISVAQDNGESLRAVFVIRDILYFVKERSLWATRDDGIGPPSTWTVEEVSPVVGTFSPHGVSAGEDWAVIAGQEGAYFFNGGVPIKLSNEIDAEWRRIDWRFSHLIWIINHVEEQRFMIGFPDSRTIPTNNEPDRVWMMDYQEGFMDPLKNNGKGRQWAIWEIPANSAAMVERGDARVAVAFYGSNGGPSGGQNEGEILAQDIVGAGGLSSGLHRTDNGVIINAFYRTAFLSHDSFAGRQLFAYLTTYAYGNGTLDIDMFRPDESSVSVRGFTLPGLGVNQRKDFERQINLISERVSFRFGIDVLDESFTVSKFVPWSKASPFDFVRGTN